MLTLSLHRGFAVSSSNELSRIPFEINSGLMIINATMDGQMGKFIFDTGANSLMINSSNNEYINDEVIKTLHGSLNANYVRVSLIRMGSLELENLNAFTTDLSSIEYHVGSEILGIIGAKMLDSEILSINTKDKFIEVIPRKVFKEYSDNYDIKIPFAIENDVPLVELEIADHKCNFILDTGSTVSIVSDKLIAQYSELFVSENRSFDLITAAGVKQECKYYSVNELTLKGASISNISISSMNLDDMNKHFENRISGILSIEDLPFQSMVFDYRNNVIYGRH